LTFVDKGRQNPQPEHTISRLQLKTPLQKTSSWSKQNILACHSMFKLMLHMTF